MHLTGEDVSEIQFRFIFPALFKCNFDFILESVKSLFLFFIKYIMF